MYGRPTRNVPPPFGTGSPDCTTRGLAETPYFGSSLLVSLLAEPQCASVRQAPATAANRAARQNGSPKIVPIVPKYHVRRLARRRSCQSRKATHIAVLRTACLTIQPYRRRKAGEMGHSRRW